MVAVVAPRASAAPAWDATLPYRVRRYATGGKLRAFVAMFGSLLGERLRSRSEATIASIWFPGGLAAMLVPAPLRGRLIVLAHGSEIAPSRFGIRRALMRWVLRSADIVAANSSFTAELLAAVGVARNVRVIPCGVDATDPPSRAATLAPTILAVGRLVARKGFDRLIERCAVLLHLVDGAAGNAVAAWRTVRHELTAYGGGLADKPEIIVLNKADAMTPREISARRSALAKASGAPVMVASGVSGQGVQEVLRALQTVVTEARQA